MTNKIILGLIIGIELVAYFFGAQVISNPDRVLMQTKIANLKGNDNYELLVFGGSSANNFNTRLLSQKYGLPSYNYSLLGNFEVVGNYIMLKKYLDKHPAPKTILYSASYDIWARDLESRGAIEMLSNAFFMDFLGEVLLNRIYWKNLTQILPQMIFYALPSQRIGYELKNMSQHLTELPNYLKETRAMRKSLEQEVREGNGHYRFANQKASELGVKIDFANHVKHATKYGFEISAENQYFLDKFIELAEEHDIQIYFVIPPLYKLFLAEPHTRATWAKYREFLMDLNRRNANVHFLDTRLYQVEAHDLHNTIDHLSHTAQPAYTEAVYQLRTWWEYAA